MEKVEQVMHFIYSDDKILSEMRFSLAVAMGAIFMILLPNLLFNQGKDEYDEIIEKYSRAGGKQKKKRETPKGDQSIQMRKGVYTQLPEE